MKKLSLAVAILMAFAMTGSAALVNTCDVGDDVLSGGYSCQVANLTFSNFTAVRFPPPPGSVYIGSSGVLGSEVYLTLQPGLSAGQDMWFYYTVTGTHYGVDLEHGGSNTSILERVCDGQGFDVANNCVGTQLAFFPDNTGAREVMSYAGGPVNVAMIYKDILVGDPGHMSSFTQSFAIPEPVTLSLIGAGLLALGLLRRRLKK
jgi:hypothetical protein